MARRFLDRKILLRSLGLAAVGVGGMLAHHEYQTFNDDFSYSFSAVESARNGYNSKLSTRTRKGLIQKWIFGSIFKFCFPCTYEKMRIEKYD